MLTETLSGKCPCCGYNKLLQRYGSSGYEHVDACAKCGFGYCCSADVHQIGPEVWIWYGISDLLMTTFLNPNADVNDAKDVYYNEKRTELENLPIDEVRKLVFDWCETLERSDDVETTIFVYSQEDIDNYKAKNNVIF